MMSGEHAASCSPQWYTLFRCVHGCIDCCHNTCAPRLLSSPLHRLIPASSSLRCRRDKVKKAAREALKHHGWNIVDLKELIPLQAEIGSKDREDRKIEKIQLPGWLDFLKWEDDAKKGDEVSRRSPALGGEDRGGDIAFLAGLAKKVILDPTCPGQAIAIGETVMLLTSPLHPC